MKDDALDWGPYRSFHGTPTARTALRVTKALLDLYDRSSTGAVKRNRDRVVSANDKLRDALDRRGALASAEGLDGRPVDLKADRVWGALESRLSAWAGLELLLGAEHAKVKRAKELLAAIFANGTEFLKLPYAEQEVEMERLLRVIEGDALERDLVSLAGREFVDALAAVQPEYAAMVRAMLERDDQKERVVGLVRDVARAVESYAGSVLGAVDEEDPDSVAATRRLLTPLANQHPAVSAHEAPAASAPATAAAQPADKGAK